MHRVIVIAISWCGKIRAFNELMQLDFPSFLVSEQIHSLIGSLSY